MLESFKTTIERTFEFRLNTNQLKEITRLVHEICKRDKISENTLIETLRANKATENAVGKGKFHAVKEHLITLRFPLTSKAEAVQLDSVFLADMRPAIQRSPAAGSSFIPEKIFIERNAKDSYLSRRFQEHFPDVEIIELNHAWEYDQEHKFELKDLKRRFIFIVTEHWDFIKPCPCTQNHLGCNYWILNLGFGCPYDCSYCFLQQYSNFPGIVLPANLDDFFDRFDAFYKKINRPFRIGTGEFCDSLALDHITGYARQLTDFFRDKPVLFELKTKSDNIAGLLAAEPAENVIISWSLNPPSIIDAEEPGAPALSARLAAARQLQNMGFSLAFHFDPVIYSPEWTTLYKEVINALYQDIRPPFRWISIGTLRGTRTLKTVAEQRFPESTIFYGELLLGPDKKLRYPQFLRKEMYAHLRHSIRAYDPATPLYLCMEDHDCWQVMDKKPASAQQIEDYLLGK